MLQKGAQKITIEPRKGFRTVIHIEADASFTAYGVVKDKRELVLGPFKADARRIRYLLPNGYSHFEVATAKSTFWQYKISYQPDGLSYPDATPVALPLNADKPLSLREEMRRFIRQEFSSRAEIDEQETFEEANDFEIDEDPDPISHYELIDLVDEYPESESQDPGGPIGEQPDTNPPEKGENASQDNTEAQKEPKSSSEDQKTEEKLPKSAEALS